MFQRSQTPQGTLSVVQVIPARAQTETADSVSLQQVQERLKSVDESNVTLHDALWIAEHIPTNVQGENSNVLRFLCEKCLSLLKTTEWKVRKALGECCARCTAVSGATEAWKIVYAATIEGINFNIHFQRTRKEYYKPEFVPETIVNLAMLSTEGWGPLETLLWLLIDLIKSENVQTVGVSERQLLDILKQCYSHKNRFVRQVGFALLEAVCTNIGTVSCQDALNLLLKEETENFLAEGLRDRWAQVRYSATLAARSFLNLVSPNVRLPDLRPAYFLTLLPALFFSRRDPAEGVRAQALVNWRRAVGMSGKQIIADYVTPILKFALEEQQSDTYELRLAAVEGASELIINVDSTHFGTGEIDALLGIIIKGLSDYHWTTRFSSANALHDVAMTGKKVFNNVVLENALLLSRNIFPCLNEKAHEHCDGDDSSDDDDDEKNNDKKKKKKNDHVHSDHRKLFDDPFSPKDPSITPTKRLLLALLPNLSDIISGVRKAAAGSCVAIVNNCERKERAELKSFLFGQSKMLLQMIEKEPIPEGKTKADVFSAQDQISFDNSALTHQMQASFGCCALDTKPEIPTNSPWQSVSGGIFLFTALIAPELQPADSLSLSSSCLLSDSDLQQSLEFLPLIAHLFECKWFSHYHHVHMDIKSCIPQIVATLGSEMRSYRTMFQNFLTNER